MNLADVLVFLAAFGAFVYVLERVGNHLWFRWWLRRTRKKYSKR